MKRSTTAIAAIIAAAGFAGAAHAQSMTPPGTSPAQNMQSNQYTGQTPPQPNGAQYNPNAAQAPTTTTTGMQNPGMAQRSGVQPPSTAPNGMQQPGMAQSGRPGAGNNPFWSHHLTKDEVREAQQRLAAQGLYRGREDGLMGSATGRAIAQFQRQNGLRVTGTLDQATLDRLNGAPNQGYGATAGQQPMAAAPMNQAPGSQATSPTNQPAATGSYAPSAAPSGTPSYGSHAQPR